MYPPFNHGYFGVSMWNFGGGGKWLKNPLAEYNEALRGSSGVPKPNWPQSEGLWIGRRRHALFFSVVRFLTFLKVKMRSYFDEYVRVYINIYIYIYYLYTHPQKQN